MTIPQKLYLLLPLMIIFLTSCGGQEATNTTAPRPKTLTVFAAASLTEAFTQIAAEFEATQPDIEIILNFAGSQTLRLQLEQGAPADIFASANQSHMQALLDENLIAPPLLFTKNELVIIVPASNPASIQTLVDLAQPGLKLLLAAPQVPVGRYAREALQKLNQNPSLPQDYAARVLQNLVSDEDNVKAVLTKIRLGEADAGIVYSSDITLAVLDQVMTIPIPAEFNIEATYPIALTIRSQEIDLAHQFIDFVLSQSGQAILVEQGFQPFQSIAIKD